jgi:hypothetical protein
VPSLVEAGIRGDLSELLYRFRSRGVVSSVRVTISLNRSSVNPSAEHLAVGSSYNPSMRFCTNRPPPLADGWLRHLQACYDVAVGCLPHSSGRFVLAVPDSTSLQDGVRWPVTCPRCGHARAYRIKEHRRWQRQACRHQTSLTAGTILHKHQDVTHGVVLGGVSDRHGHSGHVRASVATPVGAAAL